MNQAAIESHLRQYARPLDLAFYNFYFKDGEPEAVLQMLAAYQNADGGFGNGIEPDLRLPLSSAIGTAVALQYATAVNASSHEPLIERAIRYLLDTHDNHTHGWKIVPREVDDYPHAPWWGYQSSIGPDGFEWGNPAAELLGYLLLYRELVNDTALLETIVETALDRLTSVIKPDFHELLCYTRWYAGTGPSLQSQLYPTLSRHITEAVSTSPTDWAAYGATPLTFVKSPQSPFASLFTNTVLQADLDRIQGVLVDGSHWEPNWDWNADYPTDWAQAKQDWSGKLTIDNLLLLKAFGRL